jgi:hypothetical protein
MEGHHRQGDGLLLADGHEDVHLAFVRKLREGLGARDEVVGHAAAGGNHDDHAVALGPLLLDLGRDVLDAVDVADGSAAVFLDDEGHRRIRIRGEDAEHDRLLEHRLEAAQFCQDRGHLAFADRVGRERDGAAALVGVLVLDHAGDGHLVLREDAVDAFGDAGLVEQREAEVEGRDDLVDRSHAEPAAGLSRGRRGASGERACGIAPVRAAMASTMSPMTAEAVALPAGAAAGERGGADDVAAQGDAVVDAGDAARMSRLGTREG